MCKGLRTTRSLLLVVQVYIIKDFYGGYTLLLFQMASLVCNCFGNRKWVFLLASTQLDLILRFLWLGILFPEVKLSNTVVKKGNDKTDDSFYY